VFQSPVGGGHGGYRVEIGEKGLEERSRVHQEQKTGDCCKRR